METLALMNKEQKCVDRTLVGSGIFCDQLFVIVTPDLHPQIDPLGVPNALYRLCKVSETMQDDIPLRELLAVATE